MNIAVIGAGNIGCRHLQALAKLKGDYIIFTIDPSLDALKSALNMYNEVKTDNSPDLYRFENIIELPQELFVVIVATNSKQRYSVTELIILKKIKFIIFEKVLFQRTQDYLKIEKYLLKNKINAFVNCWPRYTKYFQKIKQEIAIEDIVKFEVIGTDWSIGSNMIHMLDYFSFLIDSTNLNFTEITFSKIFTNKRTSNGLERKGFYDFIGSVTGSIGGITFSLLSLEEPDTSLKIKIKTINELITIDLETKSVARIIKDSPKEPNIMGIRIPYQSERTHKIIKNLINESKCDLTPFSDSKELHLKILESFFQVFKDTELIYKDRCLIT